MQIFETELIISIFDLMSKSEATFIVNSIQLKFIIASILTLLLGVSRIVAFAIKSIDMIILFAFSRLA